MGDEIPKPEVLRDSGILVLAGDFHEAIGIAVGLRPDPPFFSRPVTEFIAVQGSADFLAEGAHREDSLKSHGRVAAGVSLVLVARKRCEEEPILRQQKTSVHLSTEPRPNRARE